MNPWNILTEIDGMVNDLAHSVPWSEYNIETLLKFDNIVLDRIQDLHDVSSLISSHYRDEAGPPPVADRPTSIRNDLPDRENVYPTVDSSATAFCSECQKQSTTYNGLCRMCFTAFKLSELADAMTGFETNRQHIDQVQPTELNIDTDGFLKDTDVDTERESNE